MTNAADLEQALVRIEELTARTEQLLRQAVQLQDERGQLTRMLDAAYPIIEAAKLLRARYTGNLDGIPESVIRRMQGFDGVPKVCPDQAGAVIKALNNMEMTCNFAQVDEVPDGND